MRTREQILELADQPRPWVGGGELKPITAFRDFCPRPELARRLTEMLIDGEISVNEYRAVYFMDALPEKEHD